MLLFQYVKLYGYNVNNSIALLYGSSRGAYFLNVHNLTLVYRHDFCSSKQLEEKKKKKTKKKKKISRLQ